MPQNFKTTAARWTGLMDAFGLPANSETYAALIAAYTEPHRAYHSMTHIDACFRHLTASEDLAERPREIELALWFHDAIYKPFSATNEEDSAEMAKMFLQDNDVASDISGRIVDLIILTKDHGTPDTPDAKLMMDIDLSILGTPPHIYAQYEQDIRFEYKRVPKFIFRKKRKEVLKTFLERPQIFHTPKFQQSHEAQARVNLAAAIKAL